MYWPVAVAQPTELSGFGIATMASVSIQSMPTRKCALFCGQKHTENWYQRMVLLTINSQFGNILH